MMASNKTKERKLTGWHVLWIFLTGFALILIVNVIMIRDALTTNPGEAVKDSYGVNQSFNSDRAAQQALGWELAFSYDRDVLTLRLKNSGDRAAEPHDATLKIGRPASDDQDQILEISFQDGVSRVPVMLAPGIWKLYFEAYASDDTLFKQEHRIEITQEGAQAL